MPAAGKIYLDKNRAGEMHLIITNNLITNIMEHRNTVFAQMTLYKESN
jgi:hypothetical protein